MPELPEVETVRVKLKSLVLNKTIKSVDVYYSKHQLLSVIENERINDIDRLGKYLIFKLDHYFMISHLRMEGKYFYKDNKVNTKHDLVCFNLDNNKYLYYNDVRKFGVFYLFDINDDIYNMEPLCMLGKEPFKTTKEELLLKFNNNNNKPIKTALLDQSIMSGIGNIYADEILFESKINPFRPAKSITELEAQNIIKNSIIVLNKSIKDGGSTIRSFESLSEAGHFQTSLKVHLRENERCFVCGNYIIKTFVNGRGTYYCPSCERSHNYLLVGITGSFSSGKSTFTKLINEMGYLTFNLDVIYNELFIDSKEMRKEIFKEFKTLDKSDLKKIVFENNERNNDLKNITHKYVMKELFKKIDETNEKIIFVEAPLLFEGGLKNIFDKIITVYRNEDLALKSASLNGYDLDESVKRLKSQADPKFKMEESDFVVYNNTTLDDLKLSAKEIISKLI